MTDVNHRRKNKRPVNLRQSSGSYHNGYAATDNKRGIVRQEEQLAEARAIYGPDVVVHGTTGSGGDIRIGKTDYLDKSMHGWGRLSTLADVYVGAGIGNDFTNGHRGMARAVKGAKKYVRSRIRFHENAQAKKLVTEE